MNWDNITKELEKKLNPKNVKKLEHGSKAEYIEGWHAIAEANRIFGFDGWSFNIELTQVDAHQGKDRYDKPQWQASYTCICTVSVDDVVRQDVGFGSGFAKNIGDAIEGATKEAATDALKRCLRTFGNQFGLALYDKTKANVGVDEPELDCPAATDRIKDKMDKCKTKQQLTDVWTAESDTVKKIGAIDRPLGVQLYNKRDQLFKSLPDDPASQAPEE